MSFEKLQIGMSSPCPPCTVAHGPFRVIQDIPLCPSVARAKGYRALSPTSDGRGGTVEPASVTRKPFLEVTALEQRFKSDASPSAHM
jgi:hypothetical protein